MALSSVLFTGFYLRMRPSHYGKFISTESLSDHKAEGSAWRGAELASRALAWRCSLPGSWGWRCVTWAGSPRLPWPWPLRPQSARWPRGALFKAQCAAVTVLNDRAQGRDIATCARGHQLPGPGCRTRALASHANGLPSRRCPAASRRQQQHHPRALTTVAVKIHVDGRRRALGQRGPGPGHSSGLGSGEGDVEGGQRRH